MSVPIRLARLLALAALWPALMGVQALAGNPLPADLIVTNGKVTTLDQRRPTAEAVAVKDGRFLAVGSVQDVLKHRGNTTKVIDIKGRAVIPGLIDSHLHATRGGRFYNLELRWDGVPSLKV